MLYITTNGRITGINCLFVDLKPSFFLTRSGTFQPLSTVSILGTVGVPRQVGGYQRLPLQLPAGVLADILNSRSMVNPCSDGPVKIQTPKLGVFIEHLCSVSLHRCKQRKLDKPEGNSSKVPSVHNDMDPGNIVEEHQYLSLKKGMLFVLATSIWRVHGLK